MSDDEEALLAAAPVESKEDARARKAVGAAELVELRARQAKARLKRASFLLGQSEVFQHFLKGSSGAGLPRAN